MKKIISFLALLIIPFIIYNCSSDIVLEPAAPLEGDWAGEYFVTLEYGSPGENVKKAFIVWTFIGENYIMKMDTTRYAGECFCNNNGLFSFTDGIRLQKEGSTPLPPGKFTLFDCTSCNDDYDPNGRFIREWDEDTLVLKQREGTTFKEIRLGRAQ